MRIGLHYFFLRINEAECFLDEDDPSFYAPSIKGNVVALDDDALDRGGEGVVVGKFKAYYIDVCAAMNAGASIFQVFDSRSSTVDYYGAIFDEGTFNFTNRLEKMFNHESVWGNFLILDRLEILPEYRGSGLGLIVLRRLIERFSAGAAYIIMKPFPLQGEPVDAEPEEWNMQMQLTTFSKDVRRSTAKLRHYYELLGFEAMRGTPFLFRLAGEALPSPAALLNDIAIDHKKA